MQNYLNWRAAKIKKGKQKDAYRIDSERLWHFVHVALNVGTFVRKKNTLGMQPICILSALISFKYVFTYLCKVT